MKKMAAEQKERFLFAIVLLIGTLLMLIAGQFALQMPRTWQINDTNMDSKLNPNEVYAIYREDYDFRLAPLRTDIPNLLATSVVANVNPDSLVPPSAVEFKAPMQIATTTPFRLSSPTTAASAQTSPTGSASVTALPASTETSAPTLTPSQTPLPTSTARRTATRTAVRTRTPTATAWPTDTFTPVIPTEIPIPEPVDTATHTPTPTPTHTATATFTLTPEPTATFTPTETATNTAIPTLPPNCTLTDPVKNEYTIPEGGCTASFTTDSQGAILSLNMVGSGNLSISWYGLLENQTTGTCAPQSANLTPGLSLTNIAVVKETTTSLMINNSNNKTITIQISVSDWLDGGCE